MPVNGIQRAPQVMAQPAVPNAPQAKPARAGGLVLQLAAAFNQPATPAKPLRRAAAPAFKPQQIRPLHEVMEMQAVAKCQAQLRLLNQAMPHKVVAPARPAQQAALPVPAKKPDAADPAKKNPPAVAPKNPAAVANVRQAMHAADQAKPLAGTSPQPIRGQAPKQALPLPAPGKKTGGARPGQASDHTKALVARRVRRHLQALKQAKPNALGYRRLTAQGKADSKGVRPKWVFYIHKDVHKNARRKLDRQNEFITRCEVGPAMAPDKKTAGGFKDIEHRQGGMITLVAKRQGANLAADITVQPKKYAKLANFIPTVVVEPRKVITRDGGPDLKTLINQGTRLTPSDFERLVVQMSQLHNSGIAHGDIKPANLVLHPQKGVCAIDTDGMAYMKKNNVVVYTSGYMPDELAANVMDGVDSAYKTADEYAMLLSIIQSTQPREEARDPDFVQGHNAIFARKEEDRCVAHNTKTAEMIDRWINRHVKQPYRAHARYLLSQPLEYSKRRDSQGYPPLEKMLYH